MDVDNSVVNQKEIIMKNLFLFMILFLVSFSVQAEEKHNYKIPCKEVGIGIYRCENEEVICYKSIGEAHYGITIGFQCKFKK